MNRILVIRGGAIGDFVLTLPSIKLLRDRFPRAHIEILGHNHITALAAQRFYADATRSIEDGSLAAFFAKGAALPGELTAYFGRFDLIVSYLFDPDGIFHSNLKRCGIKTFIEGRPKLNGHEHAAFQLARPLEQIGLHLRRSGREDLSHRTGSPVRPAISLAVSANPVTALHPGSGSATKNWPIEKWEKLGEHLFSTGRTICIVAGEADDERMRLLETAWEGKPIRFARNLPLPHLAALFEASVFVGHDSGISHIAAAAGARCVLLFGPTDPAVWAPANENVTVLRAPEGNLGSLSVETVAAAVRVALP